MNAVNCLLETLAQLHLVDEEAVACALFVPFHDFAMQRVVLEQRLVVEVQQVDVDVVGGWVLPRDGGAERLHELRLAGATHPRDHLDVPGALKRPRPLHIRIAVYPSHHPLLLGFETRIISKFRNREGNMFKDASVRKQEPALNAARRKGTLRSRRGSRRVARPASLIQAGARNWGALDQLSPLMVSSSSAM